MLYLTAVNPTGSVLDGFLPAAKRLGVPVTVLTCQPQDWTATGTPVAACDVRDPRAVIQAAYRATGLLSNSDHLQVPTALAADYLGLPGKDWRAALRTKDKHLMRRSLADAGLDSVTSVLLRPGDPVPKKGLSFPLVVKPREGVASEDVYLVGDRTELAARIVQIRCREPDAVLVVEEYLAGPLHTFETLNGAYLGGWRTTLGPPPTFVEERLDWDPLPHQGVRAQLDALGVGFGACHTEFVVQGGRARLIEVNYRLIGDRMDLILAELLGIPLFEHVIRTYLGETLPEIEVATGRHARVEYVCAKHSGTLAEAPPALDGPPVTCRPLRRVGERIEMTGTNRDYLAVLHAIGPSPERVAEALREFRKEHRWTIT